MPTFEAEGMEGMLNTVEMLKEMGSTIAGVELAANKRRGGVTNSDIIGFHAEGIDSKEGKIVRNILATPVDVNRMAEAFMAQAGKGLEKIQDKKMDKSEKRRKATAITAKSLRKAAEVYRPMLVERVDQGVGSDGQPLKKVTKPYATTRLNKYGTPLTEVMGASGDLLSNLVTQALKFTKK